MDGDNRNLGNYIICPTCKGKGYCENIVFKQIKIPEKVTHGNSELLGRERTMPANVCKPRIGTPKTISTTYSISKTSIKEKIPRKMPILPNKLKKTTSISCQGYSSDNDIQSRFSNLMRTGSRGSLASDNSDLGADLIGFEEVDNPLEYSKIVQALLTSKDWSNHMSGLQRAVHLSRVEPHMAIDMGRIICRTILDEMNSLRSKCVRVACQAAKEIFRIGGGFIFRPMFDEIVNVLLNRTADSKKIIREDADDALGVIASYCPVLHVTRAFARGTRHRHQLVRKSALRMLKTMINRIGISSLIKTNNYKDVRGSLLEAACYFLDDPIAEIRNSAKHLMDPIVKMPEFDSIIPEINKGCYKRIEKILYNLKYDINVKKT